MGAYFLARRLLTSLIVVAGVLTLTFFVSRMLPSDPARLYAGPRARPDQLMAIRLRFGLDQPLTKQYVSYISSLLHADFGDSFRTKRSVRQDLSIFLPATLELVFTGFGLAVLIGVPAGVFASLKANSFFDRFTNGASVLGASTPVFALALLVQQVFVNQLHWLPLNGRLDTEVSIEYPILATTGFLLVDSALAGNWVAWRDAVAHLVLPALVVASYPLSIILRMTRNCMVDALHSPYITVVHAKGMPNRIVLLRHALRNAILPVLTLAGLTFAYAITGSIFVELLFRWPGLGMYVTDAIISKDFPVILAVTLVSTLIFVGVTFCVDVLRMLLDPRSKG